MQSTKKPEAVTVYISEAPEAQDSCSSMSVATEREAEIMLWALAKQAIPEWAMFTRAGSNEPTTNADMGSLEVPAELAAEVAAEVERQNKVAIETIVVEEGLNSVYDKLAKHFGDLPDFVQQVSSIAEAWAKDCYQHPVG